MTKDVQNLYSDIYEALLKEIQEDLNQRDISLLMFQKTQYCGVMSSLKLTDSFHGMPIIILTDQLLEWLILKLSGT